MRHTFRRCNARQTARGREREAGVRNGLNKLNAVNEPNERSEEERKRDYYGLTIKMQHNPISLYKTNAHNYRHHYSYITVIGLFNKKVSHSP